jgi:hypothetical protein
MLWIPALCGVVLFVTQIYSRYKTGSMDNPWVPLYCCFITIWAIYFSARWKQLEKKYQSQWGTESFEKEEEDRRQFILSEHTIQRCLDIGKQKRIVYECDQNHRSWALARSGVVISSFISAVCFVVAGLALLKYKLVRWLHPMGLAVIGKGIGALLQACSIMGFNLVYKHILKGLTDHENWQTPTQVRHTCVFPHACISVQTHAQSSFVGGSGPPMVKAKPRRISPVALCLWDVGVPMSDVLGYGSTKMQQS